MSRKNKATPQPDLEIAFGKALIYLQKATVSFNILSSEDLYYNNRALIEVNGNATFAAFALEFGDVLFLGYNQFKKKALKLSLNERSDYLRASSHYLHELFLEALDKFKHRLSLNLKLEPKTKSLIVPDDYPKITFLDFNEGIDSLSERLKSELGTITTKLETLQKEYSAQEVIDDLKRLNSNEGIRYEHYHTKPDCLNVLLKSLQNHDPPLIDKTLRLPHFRRAFKPGFTLDPIKWHGTAEQLHYFISELESKEVISFNSRKKWSAVAKAFCKPNTDPWPETTLSGNGPPKETSNIDSIIKAIQTCIGL
ncbi:hypothetical protein [Rufibacter tibetensis]|uniref:Uncharacterized protein n=1 Tax=Rufibacter tibetensis TaxID=512763 RepID=A0A0P0CTL4_9BACT|nr:hypothetical protein [Rufibacter tibetensis]ALI98566.1 hypothetical protein DC20_05770 [Rufibacter tibetensis]